ncbi:conserved virulence factor B [Rubritalea halochordaticola]|uniref:Conserved virulence factor B n=2 Tax=Rubritalea halochordaticola TaxID=714537 RepID=A0ABP9V3C3_9BACT
MIELGRMNTLEVSRVEERGVYLMDQDEGEILLPAKEVPASAGLGSWLEVFVYRDSKDRLIATTSKPKVMVGEFAALKVTQVNPHGAFLDWGLVKDLMLPFGEQKKKVSHGKTVVVRVYVDEDTDRIAATTRLGRFLGKENRRFLEDEQVEIMIVDWSELGYRVIVDGSHWGLIYHNQIFQPLTPGQTMKAYVQLMRPDGKLDIVLQKGGPEKVQQLTTKILDKLKSEGGYLALGDKSDSTAIRAMFGVSKKTYKKALGQLYKEKKITFEDEGIRLVD